MKLPQVNCLHYTALQYATLCHTALPCPTLRYSALLSATLRYAAPLCATLRYSALLCATLRRHAAPPRCAMLRCAALHSAALLCSALRCTAKHSAALRCPALPCAALRCLQELTGDHTPDARALLSADIIVATPEKWDGISRHWQARRRGSCSSVRLSASCVGSCARRGAVPVRRSRDNP